VFRRGGGAGFSGAHDENHRVRHSKLLALGLEPHVPSEPLLDSVMNSAVV